MYQVLAAEKCLKEQKLECPEYPLEETGEMTPEN